MKNKVLGIILVLLFVFSFCSCINQEKLSLKEVGQDEILYTSLTKTYDYEKLYRYLEKEPTLNDVCAKYRTDCYKQFGNSKYIVLKTTEGIAAVFFADRNTIDGNDLETNKYQLKTINIQIVSFSSNGDQDFFKNAQAGLSLEDVQAADPSGDYPFLYHDWSGYPKFSYHYFESGDCYFVCYDDTNTLTDISHFTI